jgi:hypothetical protein
MKNILIFGFIILLSFGCTQKRRDWGRANCVCIFSGGMGETKGQTESLYGTGLALGFHGKSIIRSVLLNDKSTKSSKDKGNLGDPIPVEPVVYIWRDFSEAEVAIANQNGLLPGRAYLRDKNLKFEDVGKVDLTKSNNEICAIFGL